MATARAIANGNWSATSTWNGGVLPGNGDTVYANGFNVTIDQNINIGGANNPTVNAGSFVSGQWYQITFVGTTAWVGIGAGSASIGVAFLATGAGTGTGQAQAIATLSTAANTAAGATGGGGNFAISSAFAITTDLRAGTTTCLSVTGATNLTLSARNVIGGSLAAATAINYAGSGTITFNTGCTLLGVTGSALTMASGNAIINSSTITGGTQIQGVINTSTSSITVSNSAISGGGSNGIAIQNNTNFGSVVVTSSTLIGGSNGATAITNLLAGSVSISGSTITAGNNSTAPAVINASAGTLTVTNSDMTASAFVSAVTGANTSAIVNLSGNFFDHWQGFPAVYVAKYKLNTAPTLGQHRYALAGTTDSYFTMYGADNGAFGNPIAANVRSGVVYGGGNLTGTCAVPAAGSVSLGVPVDAGFGTAVLTADAIRTELATELGRLDASVSSRLAPSGTLATVTTLTNAPSVPTPSQIASQVRTELSSELAKVSALNPTRLGQVTTTEILGNLLAQANS